MTTHSANNIFTDEHESKLSNITTSSAVDLDNHSALIAVNNAKVSSQWTTDGNKIYVGAKKIGIQNSNPTSDLEIGDGTDSVRLRLNGSNVNAFSSEIVFTDGYNGHGNPEYYNGAAIRWHSDANALLFTTDNGNDGVSETAGFIQRSTQVACTWYRLHCPTEFVLHNVAQTPRKYFLYARRIKIGTNSSNNVPVTNSSQDLIYLNKIESNITNDESNGNIQVGATGLYLVVANLTFSTSSDERSARLRLINVSTGVAMMTALQHLSKEENSNFSYTQIQINAPIRLVGSTNYRFQVETDDDGDGSIVNGATNLNSLRIEGLCLPTRSYVLASDYPAS